MVKIEEEARAWTRRRYRASSTLKEIVLKEKDVHTATRSREPHQEVPHRRVKGRLLVGIGSDGTVPRERSANSIMTQRQRPRKVHPQQPMLVETILKQRQRRSRKPKPRPGTPAAGDSFFLEEPDDEGISASVKVSDVKTRKRRHW